MTVFCKCLCACRESHYIGNYLPYVIVLSYTLGPWKLVQVTVLTLIFVLISFKYEFYLMLPSVAAIPVSIFRLSITWPLMNVRDAFLPVEACNSQLV